MKLQLIFILMDLLTLMVIPFVYFFGKLSKSQKKVSN